jgi:hypothetical protein
MENNVQNLLKLLNEYKSVPFVDRVLNPQQYPKPTIFDDRENMQTHFMSAANDKEGNWYVFPKIIFEEGKYKKFETEDEALRNALSTGNIIPFGKDKDKAIEFSKNYKPEEFKEYYRGLLN